MNDDPNPRPFLRTRWGIGFLTFLAVAAVLLVFDHWTHIAGSSLLLPLALLAACLGMHVFMHGGHGGHGKGGE
jgi:hypothetical protein